MIPYRRLQGIMVGKGNPKKVGGLEDVLRSDIVFVNRNRGSGTRILVDHYLAGIAKKRGEAPEKLARGIRGYRWEAKTHSAVGAAVHQGRADMGVGVKSVAANYGLDFIPMEYEEYDFLVNPASRGKPMVKRFLECLELQEFRDSLEKLPGYKVG